MLAELSLLPSDVLGQGAWAFLQQNHSHPAGACLCQVPAFTPATVAVGKGGLAGQGVAGEALSVVTDRRGHANTQRSRQMIF